VHFDLVGKPRTSAAERTGNKKVYEEKDEF
jgi:hypothetical protein